MRLGYDGRPYAGWARQPGLRTVEGELGRGLVRQGIVTSLPAAGLEVASRTDRGVSALGNAVRLSSSLSAPTLLRALNGVSADLFATAAVEVPAAYRVRAARRRRYRYVEVDGASEVRRVQRAADVLVGEVDVRSFGRGIPSGRPMLREIESVRVEADSGGLRIEVVAPSFVWGMVRKLVSALREVRAGRLSVGRLEEAVRGRVRLTLPLAEPEGLVLCDVEYETPWTEWWPGPNRYQARWLESMETDLLRRRATLAAFRDGFGSPRGTEA